MTNISLHIDTSRPVLLRIIVLLHFLCIVLGCMYVQISWNIQLPITRILIPTFFAFIYSSSLILSFSCHTHTWIRQYFPNTLFVTRSFVRLLIDLWTVRQAVFSSSFFILRKIVACVKGVVLPCLYTYIHTYISFLYVSEAPMMALVFVSRE